MILVPTAPVYAAGKVQQSTSSGTDCIVSKISLLKAEVKSMIDSDQIEKPLTEDELEAFRQVQREAETEPFKTSKPKK